MAVEQGSVPIDTQKKSQDRAHRAMRKAAREEAEAAEMAQILKVTRSAKTKVLEDKPWARGFERVLGDDGKPIKKDDKAAKRKQPDNGPDPEGKKKKKKKKKEKESDAALTRAGAAQTVVKQSTPAAQPRPVLPRTTFDSDDDLPLSAARVVVPPKRNSAAKPRASITAQEPASVVPPTDSDQRSASNALAPTPALKQDTSPKRKVDDDSRKKSKDTDKRKKSKDRKNKYKTRQRSSRSAASSEEEESSASEDSDWSCEAEECSSSEYSDSTSDEDEESDIEVNTRNDQPARDDLEQEIKDLSVYADATLTTAALDPTLNPFTKANPLRLQAALRDQQPSTMRRAKRGKTSAGSSDEEDVDTPPIKRSKSDKVADAIERPTFRATSATADVRSSHKSHPRGQTPARVLASDTSADIKIEDDMSTEALNSAKHRGQTLDGLRQHEARYDSITRLVWSEDRDVRLTDQAAHIAKLMRNAMNHTAALVAFEHALHAEPDRSKLQRQIVLDQAIALGKDYTPIVEPLESDYCYMEVFVKAVEQRNANLRSVMKKFTDLHVISDFALVRGECAARVAALLVKQAYVYPGDALTDTLDGKKPFYRDIIIDTIRKCFFHSTSKKPSVASLFPERFTSSDPYKADELEIPIPMLALSCAMIKLSLDLWSNGRGPAPKEDKKRSRAEQFSVSTCLEEYKKVLKLIGDIRRGGARTYHRVMHDVYLAVCGSTPIGIQNANDDDSDPRTSAVSRVVFDAE